MLEKSEQVARKLARDPRFRQAQCIALYHALPDEVQTKKLMEEWYKEKKIVLPLVRENEIDFYPYKGESSVKAGPFGIWEPISQGDPVPVEEIDLVIVPGVAFDKNGNRLGRGKGFYDRFLNKCNAHKMGVCFDFQLFETIPVEPFDIRMDSVVTEQNSIVR